MLFAVQAAYWGCGKTARCPGRKRRGRQKKPPDQFCPAAVVCGFLFIFMRQYVGGGGGGGGKLNLKKKKKKK
jgi:hypothetical protein